MKFPPGPVTNALVLINLAIALVLMIPGLWAPAIMSGALFPLRFSDPSVPVDGAAFLVPAFLTPLSASFLHGGIAHAVLNMLMLLITGKFVERVLGAPLYILLYVIGAYAAAGAEWLAHPMATTPVVGASGAISAIIGTYVMLFPSKEPQAWGPLPASVARPLHLAVAWIAINLAMGFVGPGMGMNIAIWSHIGGFAAGLLLARPLLLWRYRNA